MHNTCVGLDGNRPTMMTGSKNRLSGLVSSILFSNVTSKEDLV